MQENKKDLEKELDLQIKRRKDIKENVERNLERLDDQEGVSSLGSLKSEKDITGYLRRKRKENR